MRSQLLVLGLLGGIGAALSGMVACSSTTTREVELPGDGGTATVDGAVVSVDAGEPIYDLPSDDIDPGEHEILAVIGDQVIVRDNVTGSAPLYAVPITGGAQVALFNFDPDTEGLFPTLGALGHWTNVSNGVGDLEVWTKATGLKSGIASKSPVGVFGSSDDGSRIAFMQDATVVGTAPTTASLAIRDATATTNLVTLAGTDAVNLAASSNACAPELHFLDATNRTFFAFFCTGTDATATAGRIYTVADNATATAVRLDAAAEAANVVLGAQGFSQDKAGTKVAYVDATSKALKLTLVATPGVSTQLDTAGVFPFMLGDGSAVIYAIPENPDGGAGGATIKKVTTAGAAITTIATVPGLDYLDSSPDGMKLVFAETVDTTNDVNDLYMLDFTQASPAVQPLLATATGSEIGFTSDSATVAWADIAGPEIRSLTTGGAPKDIANGIFGYITDTGTSMAVFSNPQTSSSSTSTSASSTFIDVGYVDVVAGGTTKSISIGVPVGQALIEGKRLVYNRFIDGDTGVFGIDLP